MTTTLTTDEIRATARLAGVDIPASIVEDDPDEPMVDRAALRGLAARGLLVFDPYPEPLGELALLSVALDDPPRTIEVEREGAATWVRLEGLSASAELLVDDRGFAALQLLLEPDLDLVSRSGLAAPDWVADGHGGEEAIVVDEDALIDADAFVLADRPEDAVSRLVDAGVPSGAAQVWVGAVRTRRDAVAVRLTMRVDDTVEVRELRWLVAGDGAPWRVEAGSVVGTNALVPTTPSELRQALLELIPVREVAAP